ncbi:MAG: hypothetical protein K2N05_07235 [Muribaculaceae bacterium]|nr:hypothetical protein [Muribaculaceae bacterium]
MKKIITFSLSLALCGSLYADEVKIYSTDLGVPGVSAPELCGLAISPNGQYICGAFDQGVAVFGANTQTGAVEWTVEGDGGGELRGIDNSGLAIGFGSTDEVDEGILYSAVTGERTVIPAPDGYRYVMGEGITPDGKMMIASLIGKSFSASAAYKIGEEAWKTLYYPTDEELGVVADKLPSEKISMAKHVSGDGKVILGFLGSFAVPVVWTKNAAGEYEIDLFFTKYLKVADTDLSDESKPLFGLSAQYLSLSENGRYVSMVGKIMKSDSGHLDVPVIYDVKNKEIIIYDEPQPLDETGSGLWPTAIANDGTFIGCVGMPYFNSHGSFIMKSGEKVAESFKDAFPTFAETLGMSENFGFNMPVGMSENGRYILGYTYYSSDDYTNEGYWVTYTIDRGEGTGVEEIAADSSSAEIEAIYSLDGRRQNGFAKGVNIVKMTDGSTKKVMK